MGPHALSRPGGGAVGGDLPRRLSRVRLRGSDRPCVGPAAPLQLAGHQNGVEAIAFSEDGRRVASGDRNGIVLVWDLRNPKAEPLRLSHPGGPIHAVAFSPDATRLASSNGGVAVHIWDLRDSKSGPTVLTHQDSVQALAFSPDGTRLASSGSGMHLWNLNTPNAPPVHNVPGSRLLRLRRDLLVS